MTIENSKTTFKTRLVNFISAFDSSPGDYLFETAQYSHNKLRELEARIARLETADTKVVEVLQKEAV
jgi:hypothetical protein